MRNRGRGRSPAGRGRAGPGVPSVPIFYRESEITTADPDRVTVKFNQPMTGFQAGDFTIATDSPTPVNVLSATAAGNDIVLGLDRVVAGTEAVTITVAANQVFTAQGVGWVGVSDGLVINNAP